MREFPSCFGENGVQVADSSSSSSTIARSSQNVVTCIYLSKLQNRSCFITVSWTKTLIGQGLSVGIDDLVSNNCICKFEIKPLLFSRRKGSKNLVVQSCKIDIFWDLSYAKFGSGPEPLEGYYVSVLFNNEIVLLLGDLKKEEQAKIQDFHEIGSKDDRYTQFYPCFEKRLFPGFELLTTRSQRSSSTMAPKLILDPKKEACKKTESSDNSGYDSHKKGAIFIAKKEHIFGKRLYGAKAQFHDKGKVYNVAIECDTVINDPCLVIRVDHKAVMNVKRLKWKFRGNHTIVVDGVPVEVFWDVHNWLFGNGFGNAVFMFQTCVSSSSSSSSRSNEKKIGQSVSDDQEDALMTWAYSQQFKDSQLQGLGFSLILYAWKNE